MFDATIDDRTRHRSVTLPVAAPIVPAPTVFARPSQRPHQPTSIPCLQQASAYQQSQQ